VSNEAFDTCFAYKFGANSGISNRTLRVEESRKATWDPSKLPSAKGSGNTIMAVCSGFP
jgi:hypothetical protein